MKWGLMLAALLLAGCGPAPEAVLESPDKSRSVEVLKTELRGLPCYRVILRGGGSAQPVVLAEGFDSMCGVHLAWVGSATFRLRLPAPLASCLKTQGGSIGGVTVQNELHEDFVGLRSFSPDRRLRLVSIRNCEGTQWDIYLRKADEPNYNAAMAKGWADESLAGGFDERRVLKSITWHGDSRAEILVQGNRGQIQTRDKIGSIALDWKFMGGVNSNEQFQ